MSEQTIYAWLNSEETSTEEENVSEDNYYSEQESDSDSMAIDKATFIKMKRVVAYARDNGMFNCQI